MRVLQEKLKVCCGLRAGKEPRYIYCDSFQWGTRQDGHFANTSYVKLKGDHDAQKGKGTTLKNHKAKQYLAHVDHLPIIEHDGLFCLYNMLDLLMHSYMPPMCLLQIISYIF